MTATKRNVLIGVLVLAALLITGCGVGTSFFSNPGAEAIGDAGISLSGPLLNPGLWNIADLMAIDWTTVEVVGQAGAQNYAGIPMPAFLDAIGLSPEAETIHFVSTDGSVISLPVADLQSCDTCLLASSQSGASLQLILPGMSVDLWAEDIVSAYVD